MAARTLCIWMNGVLVWRWTASGTAQDELVYEEAWINSPGGRPLSLSLPFSWNGRPLR